MIKTYRTCEEHDDCIVVFDYTRAGSCPVCEGIEDYQKNLDQAEESEAEEAKAREEALKRESDAKEKVKKQAAEIVELKTETFQQSEKIKKYETSLADITAELARVKRATQNGENHDR